MTPDVLLEVCREHGGYEIPALNDQLYLHFRGFARIENLDAFVNLKALWLESNGLQKLENLDALTKLRCLYVQQNLISRIENIRSLKSLIILDISQNRIAKLENIACLPCLETLNASKNTLSDAESISELAGCKSLVTADLSHNQLDGDDILEAIAAAPALTSFKITGNPVMSTSQFRKKMICRMPRLVYVDRPVFEAERLAAEAWGQGGAEAELKARVDFKESKRLEAQEEQRQFREWKAAKIAERINSQETNGASKTSMVAPPVPVPESEGSSGREVNVSKLAHGFWASNATREAENSPRPNADGSLDVASFRASSYTPEPCGHEELNGGLPLPPPPQTSSHSATKGHSEGLALPVASESDRQLADSTDFNELD